ncbi:MAG: hypothetical protein A2W90_06320 [Bacteroidetes bacterium GWF2_42_66]|nr:MAG: hypothetical protein A2W92_20830 [Bacteroidetes bacterium GWA2_42_15]OFX99650.1 MAG: hypothetical protein A2W89_00435 [Bacteroidetes bacterium GWE2_42_39]OFY39580.1 MAG: hypothetical protein A2W90_06320 [Bacteroidetes bacterium GWF2_42_66]
MKTFQRKIVFPVNLIVCVLMFFVAPAQQNKERNLLSGRYSEAFLEQTLEKGTGWVQFPAYSDRSGWERVPKHIRDKCIAKGEGYLNYEWKSVPATTFLEFVRSGGRGPNEKYHTSVITPLSDMFYAELFEGKGRFLDQIINGVWAMCEMTTWSSAAHIKAQTTGEGLPNVQEPIIDLHSARNAHFLAWINYFLKQEFDRVNPFISQRIEYEINRRVLEPFYTRDDFRWMALHGQIVGNWNPYCNSHVLATILLAETDWQKRVKGVYKVMTSLDKFTNYYGDDGGCNEGPGYWGMAAASHFEALYLLKKVTKGGIDIFSDPLIRNMGTFIYKVDINYPYFINFADAGAKVNPNAYLVYQYGKSIGDTPMQGFGAFLAQKQNFANGEYAGSPFFVFESMFDMNEILTYPAKEPLPGNFWLPDLQVAGCRDKEESTEGFFFAAKGGHNNESHNHNDVGTFVLYYDGAPLIIDVGPGTYTRQTFTKERYTIWTMQSAYHNLPTINGVMQKEGKEFKAGNFTYNASPSGISFALDLSGAYPNEALVNSWVRSYEFTREKGLKIKDSYNLKEVKEPSVLSFMVRLEPVLIKTGIVNMTNSSGKKIALRFDPEQLEFSYETIPQTDKNLREVWGDNLYRIVLRSKSNKMKGSFDIKIGR